MYKERRREEGRKVYAYVMSSGGGECVIREKGREIKESVKIV